MLKRGVIFNGILTAASLLIITCAPPPEIEPEIKPVAPPPAPQKFVMKAFHHSMRDHMRLSYDKSSEIMLGVFVGSRRDAQHGLIYYFSDFKNFDKSTLSWGPVMNVLAEISPQAFEPEIISRLEFEDILEWDKVGICWDIDENQVRHTYLVEGQKILLFLELGYDEVNNRSQRSLIDLYPSTETCAAENVFNLMVRDLVNENLP